MMKRKEISQNSKKAKGRGEGFTDKEIKKIVSGNFLRNFTEAMK